MRSKAETRTDPKTEPGRVRRHHARASNPAEAKREPLCTILPHRLSIYHPAAYDLEILYAQVQGYFHHGIAESVSPGAVVIDAGASIGVFTLELLRRIRGAGRVYAFEPIPDTFALLRRNVEAAGWIDRVQLLPCGLGSKEGLARFEYRPNAPLTSSAYSMDDHFERAEDPALFRRLLRDPAAPAEWKRLLPPGAELLPEPTLRWLLKLAFIRYRQVVPFECPVRTLSEVMREEGIERVDLLKIDVEKAELDVLHGIGDSDWPKIGAVVAEVHDIDHRVERVRSLLSSHGFGQIVVEQEWIFRELGTGVHSIHATRGAPRPALASGPRSGQRA